MLEQVKERRKRRQALQAQWIDRGKAGSGYSGSSRYRVVRDSPDAKRFRTAERERKGKEELEAEGKERLGDGAISRSAGWKGIHR
jgi:hypothetical protein